MSILKACAEIVLYWLMFCVAFALAKMLINTTLSTLEFFFA